MGFVRRIVGGFGVAAAFLALVGGSAAAGQTAGLSTAAAQSAAFGRDDSSVVGLSEGSTDGSVAGTEAARFAELMALPFRDREFEGAAALDSEARDAAPVDELQGTPHMVVTAASGLSFAGLASIENDATLDGLSAWQSFGAGVRGATREGPHVGASFGEGAVRSFRVMPRTFSAQFGGAAGAVIAVSSEAGGAKMHGSAFVLGRESAWAATNPFSLVTHYGAGGVTSEYVKPRDSLLQVGATLGGAVPKLRGKVKAFGSLEAQVRSNPAESSPGSASFYALSEGQRALLGNRGVSEMQMDAALQYLDGLTGTVDRSSSRVLGFGRVDVAASKRDSLTGAWIRNRFAGAAGAGGAGNSDAVIARGRASVGDSTVWIDAGTGRWVHEFSSHARNDWKMQVARDLEFETPRVPLAQEPAVGPDGLAPQVSITNAGAAAAEGFTFGTPASLGRTAYPDEKRVQAVEGLEFLLGKHLVAVGAGWSRIDDRVASTRNAEGTFEYDSGTTGGRAGGLVDWITDFTFNVNAYPNGACPSITAPVHDFCFQTFTQSFGQQQTEFVTHELAGYVEDAWRARKGLLVTGGVRYEYTLLPLPQTPNEALDTLLRSVGAMGTTNVFPEDRNNFAPRVGVSWSSKLVDVRVGYGLFFGKLPGAMVRAALANTALASTTREVRITPTTTANCPQVTSVNQGFGYACAFDGAPPDAVAATSQATVFAKDFRVPMVQRATLAVSREVVKGVTVSAGYEGAIAAQLPGSVDVNVAPAASWGKFQIVGGAGWRGLQPGAVFSVPVYGVRLLSGYGPVSALTSRANATYHSGHVEVRTRWARLDVRGSYTFSRAIDYGPQVSASPVISTQFDPFANGYDKGLSALDVTHRFAGDLVWRSLSKKALLRDWRVSVIGTAGSGLPYSYRVFGGTRLTGGYETLNGSGGATYLPTVGRDTLRLPMRGGVDGRVSRSVDVHRFHVEGFAEAFNLLNTRSLSRVETRAFLVGDAVGGITPLVFQDAAAVASEGVSTPAFGAATSSTSGLSRERQVEVGVRVTF